MAAHRGAVRDKDIRLNLGEIGAERAGRETRWQTAAITARAGTEKKANYRENREFLVNVTLRLGQFRLTMALFRYAP